MTERKQTISTESGQLTVPDGVSPETVAAIAAAVGAHVRDHQLATARQSTADEQESWDSERFAFAGRLDGLTGHASRVPQSAPTDKWTATDRRDRYDR